MLRTPALFSYSEDVGGTILKQLQHIHHTGVIGDVNFGDESVPLRGFEGVRSRGGARVYGSWRSGNFPAQLRGLAMDQRLAPVLTMCFMIRIEEPLLSRTPIMNGTHINDCFIITSTQSKMDECLRIFNQQ
ncbi:hypothetical protein RB195_021674 [Necator americanus]|uniref:Uncharacterized protein n=1 Tax=Necator americanus TaxID=51031 RepID=A0ABR1EC56_NECAM